jgi:hypothetical protein
MLVLYSVQWQVLRSKEQQTVLNMFNYIKSKNSKEKISWIVNETATGILRALVCIQDIMSLQ